MSRRLPSPTRRRFFSLCLGALATAGLGLSAMGCGHESGRQIPPGSSTSADLIVDNRHHDGLHVYVDGGEIGEAPAFGTARFQVLSGARRVQIRERGSTFREDLGVFNFGFDPITVTYRP